MDYEQKYKEALERAKIWKDKSGMPKDKQGILDDIFPELRESEDERIMKRLITDFGTIGKKEWGGLEVKDILAWLEKQKYLYEKTKDRFYCEGFEEGQLYEKQKEQKHVEWHREDEQNLNACLGYIPDEFLRRWLMDVIHVKYDKPTDKVEPKFKVKYAGSEYNVLEVKDIAGVTFYGIEDEPNHIDYVKAENCEIISGYAIKENGSPYPTKPAMFSEQKPTEWSEEDERMYKSIIYSFDHNYPLLIQQQEFIKSLIFQKQWKPTKAQLTSLTIACDRNDRIGFDLTELLKDLKKL